MLPSPLITTRPSSSTVMNPRSKARSGGELWEVEAGDRAADLSVLEHGLAEYVLLGH